MCNCNKGRKTVSKTNRSSFVQGSSNIKRNAVKAAVPRTVAARHPRKVQQSSLQLKQHNAPLSRSRIPQIVNKPVPNMTTTKPEQRPAVRLPQTRRTVTNAAGTPLTKKSLRRAPRVVKTRLNRRPIKTLKN